MSKSITELLIEFYKVYNPTKVEEVTQIQSHYLGKETVLFLNLKKKYDISNYAPFDEFVDNSLKHKTHIYSEVHTINDVLEQDVAITKNEVDLLKSTIKKQNLVIKALEQRCSVLEAAQSKVLAAEFLHNTQKQKRHCDFLQAEIIKLTAKCSTLQSELNATQEALAHIQENQLSLSNIHALQIQECLERANEHIQHVTETVAMEHEDILSQYQNTKYHQNNLTIIIQNETIREMQRYRFELIHSIQIEEKLRKEIRFLQDQLVIAAEKISALSNGQESYWDDEKCV